MNCAGISQTSFLKRTSEQELSDVVDTNLMATMLVCKHAKLRPHGMLLDLNPYDELKINELTFIFTQAASLMFQVSWQPKADLERQHTLPQKQES